MFMKKALMIGSLALIGLGMIGCTGGKTTTNADGSITENFSYFQAQAESTEFYAEYSDNPVMQYLESQVWNTNDQGQDVKLNFDFQAAVIGSERDITNTMLATGSYTDLMDIAFYTGSIKDLYSQGIILDLTYYVENYMPNYVAFLEAHPEYGQFATLNIDGEQKYLQLYAYHDSVEPYWGYHYRRDWIVKYADEVHDVDAFTRWEDENGDYHDDVVFPSGTQDPLYISDWEWMMRIFDYALSAEGISDGYVMSLYYPGYIGTGDLMGGGGGFYKEQNEIKYAPSEPHFRTYMQMVNTWYDNGWIDTHFAERTNELFFQTGTNYFMTGRVGIWYGGTYAQDDALDSELPNNPENGYTNDIFVWTAPQPINDVYGDESTQNVVPYAFYYPTLQYGSTVVTDAAEGKDLVALFKMIDYLYSEEGSFIAAFGLNAEQYATIDNALVTERGLETGNYTFVEVDGVQKVRFIDELANNDKLRNAVFLNRFICLQATSHTYYDYSLSKRHSMAMISLYPESGNLLNSFISQLGIEDAEDYSKLNANLTSFMERNAPAFVTGDKDPFDDGDWNAFINALNKYNPEPIRVVLQNLLDQYN